MSGPVGLIAAIVEDDITIVRGMIIAPGEGFVTGAKKFCGRQRRTPVSVFGEIVLCRGILNHNGHGADCAELVAPGSLGESPTRKVPFLAREHRSRKVISMTLEYVFPGKVGSGAPAKVLDNLFPSQRPQFGGKIG